jgi:hypothetical protein
MPRSTSPMSGQRREAGAVLITVMLVMLALLGLGVMALYMTSGNMQIASNVNLHNQALYVAEAGIEAVRNDLNGPPRVMNNAGGLLAGGKDLLNDNVPTGLDAQGQPNGVGAVYFYADNTPLSNVAFPPVGFARGAGANQSTTMGTYTVWIRNDTSEIRMNTPTANITFDSNNNFIVRSRGVAPDGRTQVTIEVAMGRGDTPDRKGSGGGGSNDDDGYSGKNQGASNSSVQQGIVVH